MLSQHSQMEESTLTCGRMVIAWEDKLTSNMTPISKVNNTRIIMIKCSIRRLRRELPVISIRDLRQTRKQISLMWLLNLVVFKQRRLMFQGMGLIRLLRRLLPTSVGIEPIHLERREDCQSMKQEKVHFQPVEYTRVTNPRTVQVLAEIRMHINIFEL